MGLIMLRAVSKLRPKKKNNLYGIDDKNVIKCVLIDGLGSSF